MATTQKSNKWLYIMIAVTIIAAFFIGQCNGINSVKKTAGTVKTITKDSLVERWRPYPKKVLVHDTSYKVVPRTIYVGMPGRTDTLFTPVDTAAILSDFYSTLVYDTTFKLRRAEINLKDTVSQNRITGRSLTAMFWDTTTVTTVVLEPPRKRVGYFSISAMGNRNDPLAGYGAGFSLKNRKDFIYHFEAKKLIGEKKLYFELQLDFPIHLLGKKQ